MPSSVKGFDNVLREIEGIATRTRLAILESLTRVGEEAVKLQRSEENRYKDQTGNLTSSIGFVVLDHGSVYRSSSFEAVSVSPDPDNGVKGGSGAEGSQTGKSLINLLAQKYATDDMALVIVAGMEYASYVENMGLNVIDTANLYVIGKVEDQVKRRIQQALKAIEAKLK